MILNSCLMRLTQDTLPSVLFPEPPVLEFAPETDTCLCGQCLLVQKTRRKTIFTMLGPFIAHETLTECSSCSNIFQSGTLLRLVAGGCNVAYDVLVFVGDALFRRHRTSKEVLAELINRNVRLSISEIEYLGRKYITLLALAHKMATPRIRQAMRRAGGYILHVDATHDGDAPALMTGIDSLSEIVLANVKVPSEHADHIVPFLRKLRVDYGIPGACVHDMGPGICKAVETVFPGIPDFICHFHFLRDIGKDFLGPAYATLRNRLRNLAASTALHALARDMRQCLIEDTSKCAVFVKSIKGADPVEDRGLMAVASAYSLALWALEGKHSGNGYGFPFDRPLLDFAQRLLDLHGHMRKLLDLLVTGKQPADTQAIFKLAVQVRRVAEDSALREAVEQLRWRCPTFDRLRKAMRIAPPDGGSGLNDEGTPKAISTIREGVERFRRELGEDPKLVADFLSQKMASQIDKYRDKLFADPIEVDTPSGPVTIYPQRTNNILEQFFRGVKRGYRRKTGNDSMRRALHAMLVDAPLVKNLDNPEYMKLLLDGRANLEELFAELEIENHTRDQEFETTMDRILPGFRDLVKLSTLPVQLVRSLTGKAEIAKSN